MTRLTNKILAYRELQNFNFDDCIDWAIEMIAAGKETPSILILAGLSKPAHSFETEQYLLAALKEWQLKIPERPEALFNYCGSLIEKIASGEAVKCNLSELYKTGHTELDDTTIFDFFLLYWAWGDLEYDDQYQDYWPDADINNIESITIATAKQWLLEN
ncbi:MAG: hypothetical protein JST86_13600 [Bacteroidetes bacterium]|nr:hypothetical protein [Bacteroidota bacterium]